MGIALMVLLGVGIALEDSLAERWYLYKLEHGDESERLAAVSELRPRSERAALALFRAAGEDTDEEVRVAASAMLLDPESKEVVGRAFERVMAEPVSSQDRRFVEAYLRECDELHKLHAQLDPLGGKEYPREPKTAADLLLLHDCLRAFLARVY